MPVHRGPAILCSMGTKSRETIYGASIRAAYDLFRAHGWLDDVASYHVDPPAPARWTGHRHTTPAGRYDHVIYDSGFEPHPGIGGVQSTLHLDRREALPVRA